MRYTARLTGLVELLSAKADIIRTSHGQLALFVPAGRQAERVTLLGQGHDGYRAHPLPFR